MIFHMWCWLYLCGVSCPWAIGRDDVINALQAFQNLSDETRLGIVLLLKEMGELCVYESAARRWISQPKICAMAMLRENGFFWMRKQGKWVLSYHRICMGGTGNRAGLVKPTGIVQTIARKLASSKLFWKR